MVIIVAQGVLLFGSVVGLFLFVYANVFIFKRLLGFDKRISRQEAIALAETPTTANTTVTTQVVMFDSNPRDTAETLFLLYQEQLRRFIDAKIDIMRSTAETQNRVMLLQAQAMCNTTAQRTPLTIESAAANRDSIRYLPTMVPAGGDMVTSDDSMSGDDMDLMVPGRRDVLGALMEHHEVIRTETKRQLDEIDEQMRTLPGPSMEGWAMANVHHTIN